MEKRNQKRWVVPLTGLILIFLCIFVFLVVSVGSKWREKTSRPLVLISTPNHHQIVMEGETLIVHATAREQHGINRMEIWADDVLIAIKESETALNPQVINTDWLPLGVGSHVLVVRARSENGTYGQASLMVTVMGETNQSVESHHVQDGENIESIAADYAVDPSELRLINHEVFEDGELSPGETLELPESTDREEPTIEERDLPEETGEEPPEPEVEEPGESFHLLEPLFFFFGELEIFELPGDPISLKF